MSTRRVMRFLGLALGLVPAGVCLTGCATAGGFANGRALGVTMPQDEAAPSLVAGEPRVLGDHVNPRFPIELRGDPEGVTVRFSHSRSRGAVVRVAWRSLALVSPEAEAPASSPQAPSTDPARVTLEDGRFVECWKDGDPEKGYRVMAQAWTVEGAPLGRPVALSPTDADALYAPKLVAIDADHAIVSFVLMSGNQTDLVAVPIAVL